MKQNTFVSGLVLASLLIALSGISRTNADNNQNDAKKSEPAKRVYDIYGKRLKTDDKYIAERTLANGRTIAYRKNKREVAALVKALKEDGVTDEKLLDANAWMTIICWRSALSGCMGGCGIAHICKPTPGHIERTTADRLQPAILRYCVCVPTS